MDFEIWCIGRILLVLGSRFLKNEVYIRTHTCFPAFIFAVYFHCMLYMFVATKMQAVTITIIRCKCRMETTRHVVNIRIRSPNRTNRPNRQRCKGSLSLIRCNFLMETTICQIEHNIFHSSNRTNRNSTCRVVNNIFHFPNRMNRLNRQTCKGSLSLMRWIVGYKILCSPKRTNRSHR